MTTSDLNSSAPTTGEASGDDLRAVLDRYTRSLNVLEEAIRSADPERWDEGSPCEEWTAREVAGHAMTFITRIIELAGQGPDPDFHASADLAAVAGPDPGMTWTALRQRLETELLARPDRLAAVRMSPLGVEMPISELLGFQGMDPVVHGWDIAVTTGGRASIPDDLAIHYRQQFEPVVDGIRSAGLLGQPTSGGADDPVTELLRFCGRRLP